MHNFLLFLVIPFVGAAPSNIGSPEIFKFSYCNNEDIEMAHQMIQQNVTEFCTYRDSFGFSPLHRASAHGCLEIAKLFVENCQDQDLDEKSSVGHWSALEYAKKLNRVEIWDYLRIQIFGQALRGKNVVRIIEMLRNNDFNLSERTEFLFIASNIIKNKVPVNEDLSEILFGNIRDKDLLLQIIKVAITLESDSIDYIVSAQNDFDHWSSFINEPLDDKGNTLLLLMVMEKKTDLVLKLLENVPGINVEIANKDGWTAKHYAFMFFPREFGSVFMERPIIESSLSPSCGTSSISSGSSNNIIRIDEIRSDEIRSDNMLNSHNEITFPSTIHEDEPLSPDLTDRPSDQDKEKSKLSLKRSFEEITDSRAPISGRYRRRVSTASNSGSRERHDFTDFNERGSSFAERRYYNNGERLDRYSSRGRSSYRSPGNFLHLDKISQDFPLLELHNFVRKRDANEIRLYHWRRDQLNAVDEKGDTPLHNAILKDDLQIVRLLVSIKAVDLGIRNHGNETPLDMAERLSPNGRIQDVLRKCRRNRDFQ